MNDPTPNPRPPVPMWAIGASLAVLLIPSWVTLFELYQLQHVRVPQVPGATPDEQSTIVTRGFWLGRQYRDYLKMAHSEGWYAASIKYERGATWTDTKQGWSKGDQGRRDAPFDLIVQPELERICPLDKHPTPDQRHRGSVFLKAFALGLGS